MPSHEHRGDSWGSDEREDKLESTRGGRERTRRHEDVASGEGRVVTGFLRRLPDDLSAQFEFADYHVEEAGPLGPRLEQPPVPSRFCDSERDAGEARTRPHICARPGGE